MKRKISIIGMITIVVIGISLYIYNENYKNKNADKNAYNILLINSYSKDSGKDEIIRKLATYKIANIDSKYSYKINTEYLDVSLMNNEDYKKDYKRAIEYKYGNKNIDFIFAISEEAFDVARDVVNDENSDLYKTPMFFMDVNRNKILNEDEKSYITGIYTRSKTRQLIEMINLVEGNVENINVIISESQNNNYMKEYIENNTERYADMNINIVQALNINKIYEKISNLNNEGKTVNIIGGEFIDNDNSVILPEDVVKGIKSYSDAPIYTNDTIYLDSGITGASILDFDNEIKFLEEELKTKIEGLTVVGVEPQLADTYKKYLTINAIGTYTKNMGFVNYDTYIQLYSGRVYEFLFNIRANQSYRITLYLSALGIILMIIMFISDQKDNLRKKNEEIIKKEKEKIRMDLIATLNHEIRTPLNIILNSSKLIKSNVENKEYVCSRLRNIDNNSYRLLRITNNILDISKIELEGLILNNELVNIVEVVEEIFQECIRFALKKNINIIFDTEYEEIFTVLDKERFQKAILNIISNSIKFSSEDSEINGYIFVKDNNVIINIEDNGIGIDNDKLPNILEKFSQTADILTRETEGTGLGLFLTKKIIEYHKGEISISSQIEEGTVVEIILPIINEELDIKNPNSMLTIKELAEIEMSDLI